MYTVGIITSSDKGYAGEREDKSGAVVKELVEAAGFTVVKQVILPAKSFSFFTTGHLQSSFCYKNQI